MINADNIWIPEKTGYIKIKYTCNNMFSGGTPSTSDSRCYENGDIPWIASGKCQDCDVTNETTFITKYGLTHSSTRLIQPNSALIAMTGATCGNAGLLKMRACANQSVFAYETNKNNEPRFLFYSIIAGRDSILLNQLGGAQAGINGQVCKNIFIPKQPLDKQISISNYLDKKTTAIDSMIEKEERTVEDLNEYKIRLISEKVKYGFDIVKKDSGIYWLGQISTNFQIMKLKYVCEVKEGLVDPRDEKYQNYPHIGPGNIEKFTGRLLDYNLVKDEDLISGKYLFDKNDVIYGKINPQLGKVCLPGFDGLCSADSYALKSNSKIVKRFLYYFLLSSEFVERATMVSLRSAMPKINREELMIIEVVLPPLSNQNKIVDYLDKKCEAIDKLIDLKQQKIEKLKEYEKSLIYECVTGRREINA